MRQTINPETIAPHHNYEWMGSYVFEGDIPPGTMMQVTGSLEVRGNIGQGCTIYVKGDLTADRIFGPTTVVGDNVHLQGIGALARVTARGNLRVDGNIGEESRVRVYNDFRLGGKAASTAQIRHEGRKMVPTSDFLAKRKHAAWYAAADKKRSVVPAEELGKGIAYVENDGIEYFVIPHAAILGDAKPGTERQEQRKYQILRMDLNRLGADVSTGMGLNTENTPVPITKVTAENGHMAHAIRQRLNSYIASFQSPGRN